MGLSHEDIVVDALFLIFMDHADRKRFLLEYFDDQEVYVSKEVLKEADPSFQELIDDGLLRPVESGKNVTVEDTAVSQQDLTIVDLASFRFQGEAAVITDDARLRDLLVDRGIDVYWISEVVEEMYGDGYIGDGELEQLIEAGQEDLYWAPEVVKHLEHLLV